MRWTCPWCGRSIEAPLGFIENAVRKHLEEFHRDLGEKARELALKSIREQAFSERLKRARKRYSEP